jgi:hypothetical protein
VLGGSGRYRRVEVVRRRAGRPGTRNPSTGVFTLNFAGVLRY